MSISKVNGNDLIATDVKVTNNELTNATYYLTFVGVTSGTDGIEIDSSGLAYNPLTNTLTLGAAGIGTLNGVATQVQTISTATNASFFPTFVDSNNGSATGETVYTDAGISYNPSTNLLSTTVTIAQTVNTVAQGTTGTYYVTFVQDNNGSATAESVFTDAGISYNPATNILTTTVTNGGGYAVRGTLATASLNPTAGTIYYGGGAASAALSTTAASRRVYMPKAGTITSCYGFFNQTASGSANTGRLDIRLNNTTDTLVAQVAHNTNPSIYSNTALSIAVAQGDYIEFKWTAPATTAPTAVTAEFTVYVS
jgi:hypothetical protein